MNYMVAIEFLLFLTGLESWSLAGFPREKNPQGTFHSVRRLHTEPCSLFPLNSVGRKLHQTHFMDQLLF